MNHRILTFGIIILFLCFFGSFTGVPNIFDNQENFSCSFGGVLADSSIVPEITGLSMTVPDHVPAGTYLRIVDILRLVGKNGKGKFCSCSGTDCPATFINIAIQDHNLL